MPTRKKHAEKSYQRIINARKRQLVVPETIGQMPKGMYAAALGILEIEARMGRQSERLRKMFLDNWLLPMEKIGVLIVSAPREKGREQFFSRLEVLKHTKKVPVPRSIEQVPQKIFHNAKRILFQEKEKGAEMKVLRERFEERWGFPLSKIEHFVKPSMLKCCLPEYFLPPSSLKLFGECLQQNRLSAVQSAALGTFGLEESMR